MLVVLAVRASLRPARRAEDLETLTPGPHTLRVDVIVAYRDGLAPLIGKPSPTGGWARGPW